MKSPSNEKIKKWIKDIKQAFRPMLEKYNAAPPRQRSQYVLCSILFCFVFIQMVFISPMNSTAKDLKSKTAALLLTTQQNREASQIVLSQVQQSIANPSSASARNLMKQIEELNSGLSVYYDATVTPAEMAEVLRELLNQDKKLVFVSMSSLPSREVLSANPEFAELSKIENRPKLYKRGVEIVFRGSYESTFSYLKRLENNPKKIFWDDFLYVVQEYPMAEVRMKVYTLTHEESWIGH